MKMNSSLPVSWKILLISALSRTRVVTTMSFRSNTSVMLVLMSVITASTTSGASSCTRRMISSRALTGSDSHSVGSYSVMISSIS